MQPGPEFRTGSTFKPLLLLIGIHFILTFFVSANGHLSWDSGTYHLMVRTLYATGGFFITNGFETISSPVLKVGHTVISNGNLVSQYPEFYTILVLPFYALFGFKGFMVLNSLAFFGTNALIWRLTSWFSSHRHAPLCAVLLYSLATYAWEYTQWSSPQPVSTFLIVLACWLAWGVFLEFDDFPSWLPRHARRPAGRLAMAGFVFAFSIGVRLDTVFAGLALGLPLLTGRGIRWKAALPLLVGAIPPLAAICWINLEKFGSSNPFSYGRSSESGYTGSITPYVPVLLGFVVFAIVYAYRDYISTKCQRHHISIGFLLITLVTLITPFGQKFLFGTFQILVDLRVRPDITEPGVSRSPSGALIYYNNVKKSLLQSCPYLILLVPSLVRGILRNTYGNCGLLWLVPVGFIAFFGYLAWHGGVALNMRYLNPTLPFLAILSAREWMRLGPAFYRHGLSYAIIIPISWATLFIFFITIGINIENQETFLLNGGLLISLTILTLQSFRYFGVRRLYRSSIISYVFVFAIVWSSALVWGRDYNFSNTVRKYYQHSASKIIPYLKENSLVISFQPNIVWGLLNNYDNIIFGNSYLGSCDENADVIDIFIDVRPVYLVDYRELEGLSHCRPNNRSNGSRIYYRLVDDPAETAGFEVYSVETNGR